jgi:hypothetical protein
METRQWLPYEILGGYDRIMIAIHLVVSSSAIRSDPTSNSPSSEHHPGDGVKDCRQEHRQASKYLQSPEPSTLCFEYCAGDWVTDHHWDGGDEKLESKPHWNGLLILRYMRNKRRRLRPHH